MRTLLLLVFLPLVGLMSTAWAYIFFHVYVGVLFSIGSGSVTIDEGSAYGVTIGTSKDQVYSDLIKSFSIRDLSVDEPEIPGSPPDLRIIGEGVYEGLMEEDYWKIRPFNRRPESFDFFFENSKLIKIHHSWAAMEGF